MHAVQALVPGHQEREYIDADSAWNTSAMAKSRQIVAGILPELEKSDSAAAHWLALIACRMCSWTIMTT